MVVSDGAHAPVYVPHFFIQKSSLTSPTQRQALPLGSWTSPQSQSTVYPVEFTGFTCAFAKPPLISRETVFKFQLFIYRRLWFLPGGFPPYPSATLRGCAEILFLLRRLRFLPSSKIDDQQNNKSSNDNSNHPGYGIICFFFSGGGCNLSCLSRGDYRK